MRSFGENTYKCVELGILQKYYNVLTCYCSDQVTGNNLYYNNKITHANKVRQRERKEIC